jgi:glycosyltransferase involved in cell wall biosynthesis
MNAPLVSIVVPTYNRAYCLRRCIESVLGQSYRHFEVIVIDDGSTDNTRELIDHHYGRNHQVSYVYQNNKGVAAARNHGLRLSQGDYVALLDSDDTWKPWKLELQVAAMSQVPEVDMVWTDMEAVDATDVVFSTSYLRTMYSAYQHFPTPESLFPRSLPISKIAPHIQTLPHSGSFYYGDIFSPMILGNLVHTSTVLIRRNRVARERWFNEKFRYGGEDYDFHLRTCSEGVVGFLDISSIRYQCGRSDQLTRRRYKPFMAIHSLKTVLAVLNADRSRITLPNSKIRYRLAESYHWVAETLLDRARPRSATKYLLQSLRHRPLQPRVVVLLYISLLSPVVGNRVRQAYRTLKSSFGLSRLSN